MGTYTTNTAAQQQRQNIECDACGKVLGTKAQLKLHVKSHAESVSCKKTRRYICSLCSKNFHTRARLERHQRTHTGQKPFVCEQCGVQYQQVNDLIRHQRKLHIDQIGDAAGSFVRHDHHVVCQIDGCAKVLATQHSLRIHLRSHTGERPHSCTTCGKSFITRSAVRRHSVIHSEERNHQCPLCFKTFKTKGHLKQHSQVHKQRLTNELYDEEDRDNILA